MCKVVDMLVPQVWRDLIAREFGMPYEAVLEYLQETGDLPPAPSTFAELMSAKPPTERGKTVTFQRR
jgi:hypothetical protein